MLQKLALNGGVCGHTFLKIVPVPGGLPRLIVLDPAIVAVRWDPEDIEQVLSYKIEYTALKDGRPIAFRQLIELDGARWRITQQQRPADSSRWETVRTAPWPFSWPPVADCQNLPVPNEYYGRSDIEDDVKAVQRAINFSMTDMGRVLKFFGHPRTWGKGFTAQQLAAALDEIIILNSKEAELHTLDSQADLASSIEYLKQLKAALHEMSRTPEIAVGKVDDLGPLSGVALHILFAPLLAKTQTKRRLYGDLLTEVNRRLLELGGFGQDSKVEVHWPELLPADPKAEAETALLYQQLGVSQDTLLQRLSFDPDLERDKREQTAAQTGERMLSAFERGQ